MSNIIHCVQMDKQQAEFLCTKIPEFRKLKPGFVETDLFIDVLHEEYDEMWPLREFLWPGFDEEQDVPITYSMAVQLCWALEKRCVEIKCFFLWEMRRIVKRELRETGVEPADYWTYWGVGRASDWTYWGV
ncbi:uncharacterized protein HD556DRAFT_1304865 [Suillus plorans]|uniref:Uncharacterized protein n=1 Tax=Suillus plorans TaxID=116603 RepID=A0A9P7DQT8_9AGAM|nr:uncharacterized protein HD556DRAFT_1304865 [Suillus plorans]KAG1800879.1 hypothetical protein HD556DRAFT_1304865 [Suillus plorans]